MNELARKIEAILFYTGTPVDIKDLAKILEVEKEAVAESLKELEVSLTDRGITLIRNGEEVLLSTAPEFASLIEKMLKEERDRDLGRAGIETLAIVAYKGPVSKKEIEYIRGVNSQFAVRNLLLRGLIERVESKMDSRVVLYSITFDALRHLGLSKIEDLPRYEETKKQLEVVEDEVAEEVETLENDGE